MKHIVNSIIKSMSDEPDEWKINEDMTYSHTLTYKDTIKVYHTLSDDFAYNKKDFHISYNNSLDMPIRIPKRYHGKLRKATHDLGSAVSDKKLKELSNLMDKCGMSVKSPRKWWEFWK